MTQNENKVYATKDLKEKIATLLCQENTHQYIRLTGCKFSVAPMLRSSAQREGNRIRRERCAKKNAWDTEPA